MHDHKPNGTMLFILGVIIGVGALHKGLSDRPLLVAIIAARNEPLMWVWGAVLVFLVLPAPLYYRAWKKRGSSLKDGSDRP